MSNTLTETAERPCIPCKKLKRKCSRELPECSLCLRVGRNCEYPKEEDEPMSKVAYQQKCSLLMKKVAELEELLALNSTVATHQSTDDAAFSSNLARIEETAELNNHLAMLPVSAFPMLFLDSVACRDRDLSFAKHMLEAASNPAKQSLTPQEIEQIIDDYFDRTHLWLPIVSRIRIKRLVNDPQQRMLLDSQVMFIALALICHSAPSDEIKSRQYYESVKSGLIQCEDRNLVTLNTLAARILVCFYEIGNGLYPAAYVTAGICARLAFILGINDPRAVQVYPRADTWTENEERRRLWWAIIIMDRCVAIGFRFRPLSISKIWPSEIIPANDTSWDHGRPDVNPILVMSIDSAMQVTSYARTCQVAHILGRVIEHINPNRDVDDLDLDFTLQEALQLHRAASSLLSIMSEEYATADSQLRMKMCSPLALLYTALMNLYYFHSCIEGDHIQLGGEHKGTRVELQRIALDRLGVLSAEITSFAKNLLEMAQTTSVSWLSPLVIDSIYQAAVYYAWNTRETGEAGPLFVLHELRDILRGFSQRWHVADEYLRLLERTEYEWKGGCRF